jgi:hypothetical protein
MRASGFPIYGRLWPYHGENRKPRKITKMNVSQWGMPVGMMK